MKGCLGLLGVVVSAALVLFVLGLAIGVTVSG